MTGRTTTNLPTTLKRRNLETGEHFSLSIISESAF
mgnify:CR=1 FL=1